MQQGAEQSRLVRNQVARQSKLCRYDFEKNYRYFNLLKEINSLIVNCLDKYLKKARVAMGEELAHFLNMTLKKL